MAIGPAGFLYKEETELLEENKAISSKLEQLEQLMSVSQRRIVF